MTLEDAIADVKIDDLLKFFNTTVSTNLIKFPLFEVVNMMLADIELPASGRGAILGAIFTTVTLPITNYRFCKSMNQPVDMGALYKAYIPTVLRDIVYGIVRNNATAEIIKAYPDINKTAQGRFTLMFFAVAASCLISSPGNEVRGYYLQPADKRKPVNEYFKPTNFIRSTLLGTVIMSTALGIGTLVTGPAQDVVSNFKAYLEANPLAKIIVALFIAHQVLEERRASARSEEKKN